MQRSMLVNFMKTNTFTTRRLHQVSLTSQSLPTESDVMLNVTIQHTTLKTSPNISVTGRKALVLQNYIQTL